MYRFDFLHKFHVYRGIHFVVTHALDLGFQWRVHPQDTTIVVIIIPTFSLMLVCTHVKFHMVYDAIQIIQVVSWKEFSTTNLGPSKPYMPYLVYPINTEKYKVRLRSQSTYITRRKLVHCNHPLWLGHYDSWRETSQ